MRTGLETHLRQGCLGYHELAVQPIADTLNRLTRITVVNQVVISVPKALPLLLLRRNGAHEAGKCALPDSGRADRIFVTCQNHDRRLHRGCRGSRSRPQFQGFIKECPRESGPHTILRKAPMPVEFRAVGQSRLFAGDQADVEEKSLRFEAAKPPDAESQHRRGIHHGNCRGMKNDPGHFDLPGMVRFTQNQHRGKGSHALAVKKERGPLMTSLHPFYEFVEISLPEATVIDMPLRPMRRRR